MQTRRKPQESLSATLLAVAPFLLVACGISAESSAEREGVGVMTQSVAQMTFLVKGTNDYENNWQKQRPRSEDEERSFINELQKHHSLITWTYLNGDASSFIQDDEDSHPTEGIDSVDIAMIASHGGRSSSGAWFIPMWSVGDRVHSGNVRMGDDGIGLKLFFTVACDVAHPGPDSGWTGWGPAFQGGLKIAMGGQGHIYDTGHTAGDFAVNLNAQERMSQSWLDAAKDANYNNQPGTLSSSRYSAQDCYDRLDSTLNDLTTMPLYRDNNEWICWDLLD